MSERASERPVKATRNDAIETHRVYAPPSGSANEGMSTVYTVIIPGQTFVRVQALRLSLSIEIGQVMPLPCPFFASQSVRVNSNSTLVGISLAAALFNFVPASTSSAVLTRFLAGVLHTASSFAYVRECNNLQT